MSSDSITVFGSILTILATVASFISYKFGYQLGSHDAAFAENKLGKDMFETNVMWGAQVARQHPDASLGEIPDLVRHHKDQAFRLTMDELSAVRRAELRK